MRVLMVACAATMLSGCLVVPVQPPMGLAFTSYQAPLDYSGPMELHGEKFGVSQTVSFVGLVALGDGSVREAMRRGGMSRVDVIDYEYVNILGVYQRYRTIAYGE